MLNYEKGKKMKTIRIILQGDRFMAYFSDDKLLLPTPFSPQSHTQEEVEALIQRKNLDHIVTD